MTMKKAAQESSNPAPEHQDIHSLMTKNISDAFQLPINEAFNLLTKQATKVAPNLLAKLAANEPDTDGRYDLSNQTELTPFRPTYTEANIKDIIKHDFFKVLYLCIRRLANGLTYIVDQIRRERLCERDYKSCWGYLQRPGC